MVRTFELETPAGTRDARPTGGPAGLDRTLEPLEFVYIVAQTIRTRTPPKSGVHSTRLAPM